jgi:hypothetical protein
MTPEELEKVKDKITQQVVGQQDVINKILGADVDAQAGAGKTAIFKGVADKIAADAFAERFKKIVIMRPMSEATIKQLVDILVDKHEKVPADRKEEAKAILQEMADQGAYDEAKGLRSLRPILNAIADVSSAPDMREALAAKYPVFTKRISINSGERLADAFTNGTAASTRALKPVRLKSRGVGFFTLH